MFNNLIDFIFFINIIYLNNFVVLLIFDKFNNNYFFINFKFLIKEKNFNYYNNKNSVIFTIIIIIFSGLPPFLFFFIKLSILKYIFYKNILVSFILYFINTLSIYIYLKFFKKIISVKKKKTFNLKKKFYKNFYIIFFYFLIINFYGIFLFKFFYF